MALNLSGLSAVYPGYQAGQDQQAKTDKTTAETQANQTKQREAAIKMLGANVAGAALAGGQQGPQAPPPGQASVPNAPPAPPTAIPPQGAPPVPQGGPAPAPAPQPAAPVAPAPVAAGAPSKMGLQEAVQRILKTTPGVANHPEILLSALTHFNDIGMLDPEAEAKVTEAGKLHSVARVAAAKGHLKAVTDMAPQTPAPGASSAPTATNPKTGAKIQWDGQTWKPMAAAGPPPSFPEGGPAVMSDASPDPIRPGQQYAQANTGVVSPDVLYQNRNSTPPTVAGNKPFSEDNEENDPQHGGTLDRPDNWGLGKWEGAVKPTQKDLDFVDENQDSDDVLNDFVRVFGEGALPWIKDKSKVKEWWDDETRNMTAKQKERFDRKYPDQTSAQMRAYFKRNKKELDSLDQNGPGS